MENAGDWSAEMAAFAIRADRESFLRIYDYFMPRLCLYLRGMGTPESMAEELAENEQVRKLYLGRNFELKRKDYLHEEAREGL